MKRFFVAEHPFEASLVKDFLASAGIASVVRGEHLFALRGGVPMTHDTLPAVWLVHEDEYARARELLERLEARARFRSLEPARDDGPEQGSGGEDAAESSESAG